VTSTFGIDINCQHFRCVFIKHMHLMLELLMLLMCSSKWPAASNCYEVDSCCWWSSRCRYWSDR